MQLNNTNHLFRKKIHKYENLIQKEMKYFEELCDFLDIELAEVHQSVAQFHHDHEAEIRVK